MALFTSRGGEGGLPTVARGKIPSYSEFLQPRTAREPEQSFDAWLDAGMGLATYHYGAAFQDAFETGGVQGFVWRAPGGGGGHVLAGLLYPSCDAVGRHYPLAVACGLPARLAAQAPHLLPLALGGYLERLLEASAAFGELARPEELAARVAGVPPPREEDLALAALDYTGWCARTRAAEAFTAIFPDDAASRPVATLGALARLVEPVRGVETPTVPFAVRLPLGAGGPASAALWLDVVRRLCRWDHTVPSAFWSVTDGTLVVALGDPAPAVLAGLWAPTREHVYDLSAIAVPEGSTLTGAGSMAELLEGLVRP